MKDPREFPCTDDAPINTGSNQVDYEQGYETEPMEEREEVIPYENENEIYRTENNNNFNCTNDVE